MSKVEPVVVFDLETRNSFDDVGGYRNTRALKMSVGVTWNSADQAFHRYGEKDALALVCLADLRLGRVCIKPEECPVVCRG
jgi:hypothetical protein